MKIRWLVGGLWSIGWLAFGLNAMYSNREPTDWNVEFYHVPPGSEQRIETGSRPICCANETEDCVKCVTVM